MKKIQGKVRKFCKDNPMNTWYGFTLKADEQDGWFGGYVITLWQHFLCDHDYWYNTKEDKFYTQKQLLNTTEKERNENISTKNTR